MLYKTNNQKLWYYDLDIAYRKANKQNTKYMLIKNGISMNKTNITNTVV